MRPPDVLSSWRVAKIFDVKWLVIDYVYKGK